MWCQSLYDKYVKTRQFFSAAYLQLWIKWIQSNWKNGGRYLSWKEKSNLQSCTRQKNGNHSYFMYCAIGLNWVFQQYYIQRKIIQIRSAQDLFWQYLYYDVKSSHKKRFILWLPLLFARAPFTCEVLLILGGRCRHLHISVISVSFRADLFSIVILSLSSYWSHELLDVSNFKSFKDAWDHAKESFRSGGLLNKQ